MGKTEKIINLTGINIPEFTGLREENIEMIRENFDAAIVLRGETLFLKGNKEEILLLEKIFNELSFLYKRQGKITANDVKLVLDLVLGTEDSGTAFEKKFGISNGEIENIILYTKSSYIKPKSKNQSEYYKAVKENDIVFAIGPAGTGKTYLAVAFAVAALKNKLVNKIILTRPAVEAGESLGFLPGDLSEKVDPYLRPLYDALEDMIPLEKLQSHIEKKVIEVIPLAYMRGRTLNNAYVILDEAQNSTSMQMKMFLTRLGANAKAIITGDITQIDLPKREYSGLVEIQHILKNIRDIVFVYFDKSDVVRHRLVKDIIDAYEKYIKNNDK